jgi:hypothetical protein
MSPPESAKDNPAASAAPANSAADAKAEGRINEPDHKAIADEARHSLFMDSVDPRFRLPDNYNPVRDTTGLKADGPLATPANPALDRSNDGSDKVLGGPVFRDKDSNLSQEEYVERQREWLNANPSTFNSVNGYGRDNRNMFPDRTNSPGQYFSDKAADFVFPGFGRFEGKAGEQDWRLDYLHGRNCRISGPSLCFSMKLP